MSCRLRVKMNGNGQVGMRENKLQGDLDTGV